MPKQIRPIRANAGIEAAYRKELYALIRDMHKSVLWFVRAAYRKDEARIAQDASPAKDLDKVLARLLKRWRRNFLDRANTIAARFVKRIGRRVKASHLQSFKEAGYTVKVDKKRIFNDVTQALIATNVNLIKSIPEHYFTEVTTIVQQSASRGGDLGGMIDALQSRYGVTRNRAKTITRDQTYKATQAINIQQSKDFGVKLGKWHHYGGAKTSRPTHKAMDGKLFLLSEGLYDPAEGRKVLPAECINCRCSYVPYFPEVYGWTDEAKQLLAKAESHTGSVLGKQWDKATA